MRAAPALSLGERRFLVATREEPEPEQQLPAPEQKCLAAAFGDGQEIVSWWGFLFFLLLLLLWTSPVSSLRHLTYLVPS